MGKPLKKKRKTPKAKAGKTSRREKERRRKERERQHGKDWYQSGTEEEGSTSHFWW